MKCRKLDKYGNTKFLAHPDLLSGALALQTSGGLGGRPPFAKYGQKSEHVVSCVVFCSVLVLRNRKGVLGGL